MLSWPSLNETRWGPCFRARSAIIHSGESRNTGHLNAHWHIWILDVSGPRDVDWVPFIIMISDTGTGGEAPEREVRGSHQYFRAEETAFSLKEHPR